jgi:hypothetical protein
VVVKHRLPQYYLSVQKPRESLTLKNGEEGWSIALPIYFGLIG